MFPPSRREFSGFDFGAHKCFYLLPISQKRNINIISCPQLPDCFVFVFIRFQTDWTRAKNQGKTQYRAKKPAAVQHFSAKSLFLTGKHRLKCFLVFCKQLHELNSHFWSLMSRWSLLAVVVLVSLLLLSLVFCVNVALICCRYSCTCCFM